MRRREEQLWFSGDLFDAVVSIPKETGRLYAGAARHIDGVLKNTAIPDTMLMSAVLCAASETDLVLGFLNQNLEVVSESTSSRQLLMDELETVAKGKWELSILGLKREKSGSHVKTELAKFIAANADLFREVQALPQAEKDQLVMQLLLLRQAANGILPKYLEAMSVKNPEKIAHIRAAVKRYQQNLGNAAKHNQSAKISL